MSVSTDSHENMELIDVGIVTSYASNVIKEMSTFFMCTPVIRTHCSIISITCQTLITCDHM